MRTVVSGASQQGWLQVGRSWWWAVAVLTVVVVSTAGILHYRSLWHGDETALPAEVAASPANVPGQTSIPVAGAQALQPLSVPQSKELYQRIITLPGAALHGSPGDMDAGKPLPVFSIFYVFSRQTVGGKDWVQVGRLLHGPTNGWLPVEQTEDWTTMLVMQYAPVGQRSRVLYFEQKSDLADIVQAGDPKPLLDRLSRGADSGKQTSPPLVAIEPPVERGVPTFANKPYLMPIGGHQRTSFPDGQTVTLIEVASLNADPPAPPPQDPPPPLKVGIVFVIDTTISMQPYIERALQTIEVVYATLQQNGLLDRASFGLVGYRNNMDQEPQKSGLEYVVKVYQDLDPKAPIETILGNMRTMHEARVSTHRFQEDAVAGLDAAIEMNWDSFKARLIIFITDASALKGGDPKARVRDVDIFNIRVRARAKEIAIFPIHLLSDLAAKLNDIETAHTQYWELGRTGDTNTSKYIPIRGASLDDFQNRMQQLSSTLTTELRSLAAGRPIAQPEITAGNPAANDLGKLIVNELFNAQMRYIGKLEGTQAPLFFKGWAADKDLVRREPKPLQALDVAVFLTRNQLNELASSLQHVVNQIKTANIDSGSVFSLLRSLAAATMTDPNRYRANFRTIGESNLLPGYLALLPYRSEILELSEEKWKGLSKTQFETLTDRLISKLRAYQDIYQDTTHWRDLGAGEAGEEVYPVLLEYLP